MTGDRDFQRATNCQTPGRLPGADLRGWYCLGFPHPYMLFAFPQFPPQREWDINSSELRGKKLRNANWKGGLGVGAVIVAFRLQSASEEALIIGQEEKSTAFLGW